MRGEPFAEEIRRVVESSGWREGCLEGTGGAEGEWEEIEKAQVLVLMVVYESLMTRKEQRTGLYLGESDCLSSSIAPGSGPRRADSSD